MSDRMRVLVVGAGGFIGRRVFAALATAGFEPVAAVRRKAAFQRMFPQAEVIACDLVRDTDPQDWLPRLAGIEAVVNCAGVLAGPHSRAVHIDGPHALHIACERAGVKRVILISAISAVAEAGTSYAADKRAAEADLKGRALDWVILRPSLVYAEGTYGGSSVLRGLAGLPGIVPLPGDGDQRFSPIHAEDLAATILRLLAPGAPQRLVLEPCGPEVLTLKDIVRSWRAWLGLGEALYVRVPPALVGIMSRAVDCFGGGPLSSTAVRQLEIGNAGDGAAFAAAIGFAPAPMRDWLARRPSSVQDEWHARLYLLRPVLRSVLGLSWIASGAIGLLASPQMAAAILSSIGLADFTGPVTWITCVLDIAIGLLVLGRRAPGFVLALQCAVILGYTLVLSMAAPALWAEPLGALVKNFAFLALACVVAALEDER